MGVHNPYNRTVVFLALTAVTNLPTEIEDMIAQATVPLDQMLSVASASIEGTLFLQDFLQALDALLIEVRKG